MIRKKQQGKVRNATPTEIDGIKFKSKLEAYTYSELKKKNINAQYESKRYILIPKFTYNNENIRQMTYLPDFVGDNFIIECKGMITDSFPLRWKIFKYALHKENSNLELFMVRNRKDVDELIKKLKPE